MLNPRDILDESTDEPPSLAPAAGDDPAHLHLAAAPPPPALAVPSRRFETLVRSPSWSDWRWQMRHRIRTVDQLAETFTGLVLPPGVRRAAEAFPLAITPYYASLIQRLDETDPIFRMAVPQPLELFDPPFLKEDPLEEDEDMPVPGLVHRYPDRALLIATSTCAMYCRHCTRKRVAGQRESAVGPQRLANQVAYLRAHPEIKDVVVSGGDPFTLTTEMLERILAAVRSVPSVEVIRIGTRTPVTLPMRVDDALVSMLRRYQPVWVNTHFNHPVELTPAAIAACARLVDAGIPVGNQSVLLKGVNDDPRVMEELLRRLVRNRIRPYYLYQCDLVRGVEHFRTPLSRGLQLMEYLRGRVSGFAIPTFVVDLPGGGGKIPLLPDYVISSSPTHTVLRNFEGMMVSYPEPGAPGRSSPAEAEGTATVFDLVSGLFSRIQPARSARQRRRAARRPVPSRGQA